MRSSSTPVIALALGLLIAAPLAPRTAAARTPYKRNVFHPRRAAALRPVHQPVTLRGSLGRQRLRYEEHHRINNGKSLAENTKTVNSIRASSACTPPGSDIRITKQGGGRAQIVGKAGPGGAMGTVKINFTAREGRIDKHISSKASGFVPPPMRSAVERTMVTVHHAVAPVERVLGDAERRASRR